MIRLMANLPDAAGQAAEVGNPERSRLEETTARMVGRMCEGMLRAQRRSLRVQRLPGAAAGGAFQALNDTDVALLAANCQPQERRSA